MHKKGTPLPKVPSPSKKSGQDSARCHLSLHSMSFAGQLFTRVETGWCLCVVFTNLQVVQNLSRISIASFLVRSPQRQVVSQELHDQRGVFVGVLRYVVKFGNCILKSCASHFACFVRVIQHLIHED